MGRCCILLHLEKGKHYIDGGVPPAHDENAALGTDLVVATAPPSRAVSASAMSEMVQELGIALGVAVLGSLTTIIYRREILGALPPDLLTPQSDAVSDSLAATSAIQNAIPSEVFEQAQSAFVSGLNGAAIVATFIAATLAILSVVALRDVGVVQSVEAPRKIADGTANAGH